MTIISNVASVVGGRGSSRCDLEGELLAAAEDDDSERVAGLLAGEGGHVSLDAADGDAGEFDNHVAAEEPALLGGAAGAHALDAHAVAAHVGVVRADAERDAGPARRRVERILEAADLLAKQGPGQG